MHLGLSDSNSELTTEDGSSTFFNEEYQEAYHSKVGAYREALEKHVIPSGLLELAKQPNSEIRILDLCFGLGYNSGVAIEKFRELQASKAKLRILALENDPEVLGKISSLKVPDSYLPIRNELSVLNERLSLEGDCYELDLLLADARLSVNNREFFKEKFSSSENIFDIVFFDPFSPKSCPELWSEDFIRAVVELAKPGAMITTYSSARIVKDNFKSAGCEISEGPLVGRRTGGVLAKKC